MMDAFSGVTEFVRMTEARELDRKFLYHLKPTAISWLVFDKAYTVYQQFDTLISNIEVQYPTTQHAFSDEQIIARLH